ncbi:hypothetical protein GEMRC1_009066 [Eukaryota sp. GEM-RC1]
MNHSSCSNSNFSYVLFNLFNSAVSQTDLSYESVNTVIVFAINFSIFDTSVVSDTTGISFEQLLVAENSEVLLVSFYVFGSQSSSSIIYVSNSTTYFENVLFQDIHCKSLIESVNSLIELNEVSISSVTCGTCFDVFENSILVKEMDVFYSSGTLFELSNVDLMTVQSLNIHDSNISTAFVTLNSTFQFTDFSVVNSSLVHFLKSNESSGEVLSFISENSIFHNMIAIDESGVKFSDFVFSNTSATRVYHVSHSIISISDFMLNDVVASASFLSSYDCTIIIDSFNCVNTNFENSTALFELIGGSSTVTNLNMSESIGSLISSKDVEYSIFHHLSLIGLQSETVLLFESVINPLLSGKVQIGESIDFFSHVILDDVSVSEFQSSSGYITCYSDASIRNDVTIIDVIFTFNDTLTLLNSTFLFEPTFEVLESQTVSGFGKVVSSIFNLGRIHPTSCFVFEDSVSLSPSSIVALEISNDGSFTQITVGSTAYLDGILEIQFDTKYDSISKSCTLLESAQIIGKFSNIINPCASLITTLYSETSLIVFVNDFIVDLQQTSYIATTGIDDPCCGTLTSPCASFKGVLGRMGGKGTVYFHEGTYSFHQGLGKVSNVNWNIIGLGDVEIGCDEVLFEILMSNFSVTNLTIHCRSDVCISVSNSTLKFNNSMVFHHGNNSTIMVNSSNFYLSHCVLQSNLSNLLQSNESSLVFWNVEISGSIPDSSTFILLNSNIDIFHSIFSNIEAYTLFRLNRSYIMLNQSSCLNSNFSFAIFDLFESEFNEFYFNLDLVQVETVFAINSSKFTINDFTVPSTVIFCS